MKDSKKKFQEKREQHFKERSEFLKVYEEFNKFLSDLGFRLGSNTNVRGFHYNHYDSYIDAMYSVEHYTIECINHSIFLIRDRSKHLIMFVDYNGLHSPVYDLDKAKENILNNLILFNETKLASLNAIRKNYEQFIK